MKHQKRIIEHLIQHSKTLGELKPSNKAASAQQSSSNQVRTFHFETHQTVEHDENTHSIEDQKFSFEVFVEIGDGRQDCIIMNQKSNPLQQAEKFCRKYNLQKYIVNLLSDSLNEQFRKQKGLTKAFAEKHEEDELEKPIGAEKVFRKNQPYNYNKNSQQIWKQHNQNYIIHPKINQVSEAIIRKMGGKDKIIENKQRKLQDKVQNYILNQIQNEQKQFQSYSFHPAINPISRKVDETLNCCKNSRQNLNRYQQLYKQHRVIQNKKELKRRNSITQIPFKPNINKVSKIIMEKKKSLGEIHPMSGSKEQIKSTKYYQERQQSKQKRSLEKRKSLNLSSSTSQLCHHLYEQAKKRQEKIQKETEKIYGNQNTWKVIQSSNSLVFNLRENRIRQIFYNLSKPPHKQIFYEDIQDCELSQVEKIFIPIFKEMKEMETNLNEEEFIDAGMRLLKYISPTQRALLIRKSSHKSNNKQNQSTGPALNKKSKMIIEEKGYGQKDIYMRGLLFKNGVKDQIEKGKEQKVRNELKTCTFKPKIHGIPSSISY